MISTAGRSRMWRRRPVAAVRRESKTTEAARQRETSDKNVGLRLLRTHDESLGRVRKRRKTFAVERDEVKVRRL